MLQIRPYQSQVQQQGPQWVQRANPEDFGSGVGQAIQGAGRSVEGLGDVVAQRAQQKEVSDLNAQMSQAHADLTVQYQQELQKGTLNTEDFTQKVQDRLDSIQQNTTTAGGRMYYNQAAAQIQAHFTQTAALGQAELAGDKAVTDFRQGLENRSSALENDPSGFDLAKQQQGDAIQAMVASGGLPASKAPELQRKGETELAKSAIYGVAKMDPDQATHELDSGKWDPYITGDQKRRMYLEVTQAGNAKRIEAERLQKQQDAILAQQQTKTQNDFLQKLQDGQLGTKDILNSNLDPFGSGSKQVFLEMLNKANKEKDDAKIRTDPYVMKELFDRVHADEDDPKRITDENDLNRYFGNGVNASDLNFLRKEVQNKGTVEGDADNLMLKNVEKLAYQQIARPDPVTGMADPKGMELHSIWLSNFLDTYQKSLAAGDKPRDLLDPSSDKYLGANISQFHRTPGDIMKSVINRGAAPQSSPMLPLPDSGNSPILNMRPGASPLSGNQPPAQESEYVDAVSPQGTKGRILKSKIEAATKAGWKVK